MIRWGRCCLHHSMRVANLFVNLCGVAMIIYSLWLLKKWKLGVSHLPIVLYIPKPWFIYACLGVGIAICLSTLFGHIVTNSTNNYILCIYIFSICSLLFLQFGVVISVFFKIDWDVQFSKYIDEYHTGFMSFVIFHLNMCRLIVIMCLVPQMNVIIIGIILWGVGVEARSSQPSHFNITDFHQSFLVTPNLPIISHENVSSTRSFRNFSLISPSCHQIN
ncbi:tetraspanin-19-like isoform X4 [Humulus lupulus]|uniref:tetraspanin-19-like isoform X4 n=1 Tax=Humulus lupulus TaxID=3486 RepID=UPI002B40DAB6|nr:tetraspanin-19-like isoform X4 [Humulus lupulus]